MLSALTIETAAKVDDDAAKTANTTVITFISAFFSIKF